MRNIFKSIRHRLSGPPAKKSFSQCGEDLLLHYLLFEMLGKKNISYLDIGAHDPWTLSNTALFYREGFKGVCIEPDPVLYRNFSKQRERDTCLNFGISAGEKRDADFYLFESKTLNTFSKEEADRYVKMGYPLQKMIKLQLVPIGEIFEKYFEQLPDFVSIDVEGLDLEILKGIDFGKFRPPVFCIETLEHSTNVYEQKKDKAIIDHMEMNDYFIFADTFLNTIFVDRKIWK